MSLLSDRDDIHILVLCKILFFFPLHGFSSWIQDVLFKEAKKKRDASIRDCSSSYRAENSEQIDRFFLFLYRLIRIRILLLKKLYHSLPSFSATEICWAFATLVWLVTIREAHLQVKSAILQDFLLQLFGFWSLWLSHEITEYGDRQDTSRREFFY